jgi:hypothetical protein
MNIFLMTDNAPLLLASFREGAQDVSRILNEKLKVMPVILLINFEPFLL